MLRLKAPATLCLALLLAPPCHAALADWMSAEADTPALLAALSALLATLVALGYRQRLQRARHLLAERQRHPGLPGDPQSLARLPLASWEMRQADLRFSHMSGQVEALLGYPADAWLDADFLGRTLHPDDAEATLAAYRAVSAEAPLLRHSHRLIGADGRLRWVLSLASFRALPDGPGLAGLLIDIDEERRSQELFRNAFLHSPDIMLLLDRDDGRILAANHCFAHHSGLDARQLAERPVSELPIWGDPRQGEQLLQRLQAGEVQNLEISLQCGADSEFNGLLSARHLQLGRQPALVVALRDLAALRQTRQQLRLSEEKFAKAFCATPDGLMITRLHDGQLLDVNPGFTRITGYASEEALRHTTLSIGLWPNALERKRLLRRLEQEGSVQHMVVQIRNRAQQLRLCELSAQPLQIDGQACLLSIIRDITERERMQEKLQQAAAVFENTAEGVMITDLEQHIVAINRAFSAITGYSESEALGQTTQLLAGSQHNQELRQEIHLGIEQDGHWQGEIWSRRKNGEPYPAWLTISAVRNGSRETTHFVAVFADITPLKHAQARLDYQAHHDPLTGLPNRLLFENHLQMALDEALNEQRRGAVLFLDLDRFKHINDTLGHPVGDLLLKGIARRLREQLREVDTVARLGGDEFIVLMPSVHCIEDVELVANKLMSAFARPFRAGEHEFFMSSSIGVSLFPEHGEDVATLVKNADAAMYRAKAKGRNRFEFYTADLSFQATERMNLENDLRRALERGELSLHYQPKQCLNDARLVGAEALLRWHHPTLGDVPPDRFIAIAEENGSIVELGDWVLEQACRQMATWQACYADFGPLAVNLSGPQLRQPHLSARIGELLQSCGLSPDKLQLEITETFVMSQKEEALPVLQSLRELGLQLAIDDFGTGYSSLSYLKRLPIDTLKIDKSFVDGLPDDPNDAAIARAIIALGRSMQLTVIAEGVETKSQERFLALEGCQQIQGYVLSRPLPAETFAERFLVARDVTLGADTRASL